MSFLSFLGKVGQGIEVATGWAKVAQPVLSVTPIGPIFNLVLDSVVLTEALFPAPGSGATKKTIATNAVNSVMPGVPQTELSNLIDAVVAAMNAASKAVPAKAT